ncbi:EndoU domain-containing protein [Brevibacillus porteri]|uniref:EndoU domain-containing protein n=1 Tax=Brevibacillus porteri TaxID=2126350 RepID=UPI003D1DB068
MEDTYKGQVDNPLTLNRYTYGHNNPIIFVDPTGHQVTIEGTGERFHPLDFYSMSHETKQMYVDRYLKYGENSIPKELRGGVKLEVSSQAYIKEVEEYGPGGAGVKIVKVGSKAVIAAVNGTKVAKQVLNTSTQSFRTNAQAHILQGSNGGGFHWLAGSNGAARIVPGTKSSVNPYGVYEAQVEFNGVLKNGNNGKSTFFPDNWTRDQVLNGINEAFSNKALVQGNTYRGTTSSGMVIEMYLDSAGKIISAFPKY